MNCLKTSRELVYLPLNSARQCDQSETNSFSSPIPLHFPQLNQQNPKGVITTQDYSFLKEASPIYVTSLSNNTAVATTSTAKINVNQQQSIKSPTVKSISNPLDSSVGNVNQHPELQQSNSTSNQLLTTSIIRKPITSTTFDNKTSSQNNNINYIASASNSSLTSSSQLPPPPHQVISCKPTPLTDPCSDLIKNSANLHNNVNVLSNSTCSQLPNNLDFDPNDGCTSYYSNNRTDEVFWLKLFSLYYF